MATRLEDEFDPTRINAPDAAYPAGSLKDETTPGVSDDGTPLASRVGNDWQGFSQSALDKAGIAANGQPDSVTNPQILQAIEQMYNDGDSQLAGGNIWPLSSQDSLPLGSQASDVPSGISILRVITGSEVELLNVLDPNGDFSSTPQTITDILANLTGGYDVITSTGTYEAFNDKIKELRGLNAYPIVTPQGWGAVGDGIADDTQSIQNAINYADTTVGVVFIPAGTYRLTSEITILESVSIIGQDQSLTILQSDHSNQNVVRIGRSLAETPDRDHIGNVFKDFTIKALPTNNIGLKIIRSQRCSYQNIQIEVPNWDNPNFVAVRIGGAVYLNYFENCYANVFGNPAPTPSTEGFGWHIGNGQNELGSVFAATNTNTFVRCSALSYRTNFWVDGARGTHFIDCNSEKSRSFGFLETGAEYSQHESAWIELSEGLGYAIGEGQIGDGSGGTVAKRSSDCSMSYTRRNIGDANVAEATGTIFKAVTCGTLTISSDAEETIVQDIRALTTVTDNGSNTFINSKFGADYELSSKRNNSLGFGLKTFNGGFELLNEPGQDQRGFYTSSAGNSEIRCGFRGLEIVGETPFLTQVAHTSNPTPPLGKGNLYFYDNAGTMELRVRYPDGTIDTISTDS